ncbi:hypothetical protein HDU98_008493 [Podochytrium sp. JEL0797]|nr:hypothetical protein HDU98_008493 [Podochytrium sp. JEL0797]
MDASLLLETLLVPTPTIGIHLWSLSLAKSTTKMTPQTLHPLSHIACLGFLDLSETDVSLPTLQSTLRQIQILRLHLFLCPNIQSVVKSQTHQTLSFGSTHVQDAQTMAELHVAGVSADACVFAGNVTEEEVRGFLTYSMPNVWILDGVPVLHHERKRWVRYFSEGGRGQFSDLVRKHFVDFESPFVPRLKKQYPPPSPIRAEYVYESPIQQKLWSARAKKLIGEMPTEFTMPLDQDVWRLKRLCADLERRVIQTLPPSVFSLETVRGSVAAFAGVPNQYSPLQNISKFETPFSLDSKICLALLIFGSLVEQVPIHLAQSALESIFEANDPETGRRKTHWAQRPVSPLLWRVQERLEYLGILLAVIQMDQTTHQPPTPHQLLFPTTHHSPETRSRILSRINPLHPTLRLMHELIYTPHPSPTPFSFQTFSPPTTPAPPSKHFTTTTHLLSTHHLPTLLRTHPHKPTSLHTLPLLHLSLLPFLIHKSARIPSKDFLLLFPALQTLLQSVARASVRLCIRRGECPAAVADSGGADRSRSRSRTRSVGTRCGGGGLEVWGPYEKVWRIAVDGVMSVREINEWMENATEGEKGENDDGGGDEESDEEGESESRDLDNSVDALEFQIKLKILEAVDAIVWIVYGELEEERGGFGMQTNRETLQPPKTPEPAGQEKAAAEDLYPEPNTIAAAYESDDEMRMFDLLRSLRMSRHPRDPVPTSLVLKGNKLKA